MRFAVPAAEPRFIEQSAPALAVPDRLYFDSAAEAGSGGLVLKKYRDIPPSSEGEGLIVFAHSPGSRTDACRIRSLPGGLDAPALLRDHGEGFGA